MLAGFNALGANLFAMTVGESRPLEIGLLAALNRRIIFGGTDAVGIAADDPAGLFANDARFHIRGRNGIIVNRICKLSL